MAVCYASAHILVMCLQACSILYKSKLPMLLVFNKTDVSRHEFALDWMADFETFHVALQADSSYASTLSKSLSLVCPIACILLYRYTSSAKQLLFCYAQGQSMVCLCGEDPQNISPSDNGLLPV